jgi:hypothetical protein
MLGWISAEWRKRRPRFLGFSEIVSEDPADFAKADHCDSLKVLRSGFVGDRR